MKRLTTILLAFFGSQERRTSRLEAEITDLADGLTSDIEDILFQINRLQTQLDRLEAINNAPIKEYEFSDSPRVKAEVEKLRQRYLAGEIDSNEMYQLVLAI